MSVFMATWRLRRNFVPFETVLVETARSLAFAASTSMARSFKGRLNK